MSSGIDSAPAPAEQSARHVGFGDRLHRRVTERRSQLVLGLDPDPMRLWPRAIELVGGTGATSDPPADRAVSASQVRPRHRRAEARRLQERAWTLAS